MDNIISYLNYKEYIPTRLDVLDKTEYNKISNEILKENPIYFLPCCVHEEQIQDEKYKSALYKIILMGVLQDGRRSNLIIDDIEPYFEVMLEKTKHYTVVDEDYNSLLEQVGENIKLTDEQTKMLNNILCILENEVDKKSKNYAKPLRYEIIKAKPFKLYREETVPFVRFYYNKLKPRSTALNLLSNYNTAHDDNSCYYRVVCRDLQISLSTWIEISKYKIDKINLLKDKSFRVNYNNIKPLDVIPEFLKKDKTMSMSWDIETYTSDPSGKLPSPNNKEDKIICIGLTFQWVNSQKSFLRICLIEYPCYAKEDTINIICCNEINMIKMFGKIYKLLQPEIIQGFHDSSYDWDWVIKRASQTTGLLTELANDFSFINPWFQYNDKLILEKYFKQEQVKVEAGTNHKGYTLMLNGYIPIDVRTIFRQLYPTAEQSSLKFYLSQNKLGGKEDMPIHILFDIYKRMNNFMIENNYESQSKIESKIINPEIKDQETYEKLKAELSNIAFYCVVDADRCHDLMKIRSVIMDKREVSKLAYCSLYDAFYRANGMKVRNLTISIGQRFPFNIRFTNKVNNSNSEEVKYPGAYVFPPKKGLKTSKLSFEERIQKCNYYKNNPKRNNKYKEWENINNEELEYYKLIVEKYGATKTQTEIKEIENEEKKLLPNKLKEFLLEPIGRPIAGLDFSSLYPSLIRTYNLSPEMCIKDPNEQINKTKQLAREQDEKNIKITKVDFQFNEKRKLAYFIHHNNIYDIHDPNFKFGVYPYILDDLFKKRSLIKKEMEKYNHLKEEMEAKHEIKNLITMPEYEDIIFNKNYLNSKQNALKVFMNTFYGECGSKISPFFVLEVAGGITSYGKTNIKKAEEWVKNLGCNIYYGDTDSIYISMPENNFHEYDKKFYTGQISKLDYWTFLVNKSFTVIKDVMNTVNNNFKNDNGTTFLSMAYEEFLYVVLFAAKKKYYGIEHKNIANFKPKDIFTRGLEVKKRGVSNFLRKEFTDIMWKSCSPENMHDIIELVLDKIDNIYNSNIDLKNNIADFIQTDVFKPAKNNIKVHTFVDRMKARGIEIKPNERFEYVIVKRYPYKYDTRGRKDELKIGDKMELLDIAIKENLEIDLDHYMKNSINGQFARLIAYHEMFHVEPNIKNNIAENYVNKENSIQNKIEPEPEDLAIAETKIYENACKYIDNYCKQYYSNYKSVGTVYKTIFTKTNSNVRKNIKNYDDFTAKLLTSNVDDEIDIWFEKYAEKNAENQIKETKKRKSYGELKLLFDLNEHIKNFPNDEKKKEKDKKFTLLEKIYCSNKYVKSLYFKRVEKHKKQMDILRNILKSKKHILINIFNYHNGHINKIIDNLKSIVYIPTEYYNPTYGEQIDNCDSKLNNIQTNDNQYIIDENDDEPDEIINELKIKTENIIKEYNLDKKTILYTEKLFQDKEKIKDLNTIKEIYNEMYSSFILIKRTESIINAIKKYRNNLIGFIDTPKNIDEIKKNTANDCMKLLNENEDFNKLFRC